MFILIIVSLVCFDLLNSLGLLTKGLQAQWQRWRTPQPCLLPPRGRTLRTCGAAGGGCNARSAQCNPLGQVGSVQGPAAQNICVTTQHCWFLCQQHKSHSCSSGPDLLKIWNFNEYDTASEILPLVTNKLQSSHGPSTFSQFFRLFLHPQTNTICNSYPPQDSSDDN